MAMSVTEEPEKQLALTGFLSSGKESRETQKSSWALRCSVEWPDTILVLLLTTPEFLSILLHLTSF